MNTTKTLTAKYFVIVNICRTDQCKESLKQLCEIASEADDLRAQALHDCCQFDALLELGTLEVIS